MMRTRCLLLAMLLLPFSADAIKLQGRLREMGTRKVMKQVNVYLLPQKLKAVTSDAGEFEFELDDDPGEEVQLVANVTGYRKLEENRRMGFRYELYLEKESYSEFETTVVGKNQKRDDQQKTLTPQEFLTAPGAGGDPVKAVQNLAGVNRPSGASAQVTIQGAEPEDTEYTIDGHPIPLVFHFGGLSSIVYPEAVESVNLYPAGYGPEFGRALGGHVSLLTRNPREDGWRGLGFVDIFNIGTLWEGPLSDDQALLVAGRYSYIGAVIKSASEKATPSDGSPATTVAPTYYDLTLVYRKKIDEGQSLRVTTVLSTDKLELLRPPGPDSGNGFRFYLETGFYRIIPQWTKKLDHGAEVNASVAVGQNNITVDVGETYLRTKSTQLSERAEYVSELRENWKSYLGAEAQQTWIDLAFRFAPGTGVPARFSSGLTDTNVKADVANTALYWRNEVRLDDQWTLIPGVRVDRFGLTGETLPAPKFALRYRLSPELTYRLASGLYFQPPSGQQASRDLGNPDIKSARAWHLNVGLDRDFRDGSTDGSTLSAGVFVKKLENLIVPSANRVTRDGTSVSERYANGGVGRIHGLELTWKYRQDRFGAGLAYTLAQSFRTQPGQSEYPSEYDQTHNLNLLGSYQASRWLWTARARYVTGSPFTPVVDGYFNADDGSFIPVRGAYFSERKAAFTQLDLRGERKIPLETWVLSFYFDIQNILNQKNIESVAYSYDYRERQDVTGLGILPTLGVKGEF